MDVTGCLTEEEAQLWRDWTRLHAETTSALQRDLQADGLSAPDFDVLVHLAADPDGRVRVTDLAGLLQWERSRLSHHVVRMEHRDLVQRIDCAEDGRGAFVAITPAGRSAVGRAAPGRARTVRRLLFDALGADDVAHLARIVATLRGVPDEERPAS